MLWIKRNLFLVVGGVVALGLFVVAGYYFWTNYQDNDAIDEKLKESKSHLDQLYGLVPFPNQQNITKASEQFQEVQRRIALTQKSFSPLAYQKVKGKAFTDLLLTTIDELQKKAAQANVALPLPKGYAFTFAEQQKRLQFSEGSFPALPEQLAEIKAICNILFDAKINKLTGLRRGRVTADDPASSADYHELKFERPMPSGGMVCPYVAEFTSFSTELAGVLEGFYKSPNGLLVKAIEVKPLEEKEPPPGGAPALNPAPGTPPPGAPAFRRPPPPGVPGSPRPGPRGRPGAPGAAAAAPLAGGAVEGMKTVLDEKMLRITLWVDVLKPPAK